MATQEEESAPLPEMVGNAFVKQYYTILSTNPEMVHKFYQEKSVIGRPDSSSKMCSATTLSGINEVILSVNCKNHAVEILTADAQESFENGVIVLVTGCHTQEDNIRRKFTQTFFLAPQAPQATGFFVLNDLLRYVDEEEPKTTKTNDADADDAALTTPLTSDSEPTLVSNHSLLGHATKPSDEDSKQANESSHPLENGKIPASEEDHTDHSSGTIHTDATASIGTSQNDAYPVSKEGATGFQEDAPKRSYAAVANALNFKKQPFQQRILHAKPVEQPRATVAPETAPQPTSVSNNTTVEKENSRTVKGHSIFVANLPMDLTPQQLREVFEKFGTVKPDGVQVRSFKLEKNCFGFVEFEDASAMQSALEVSTIMIGNRKANIEKKRGNDDGGKYPPRRGSFRNDNFRGRASFGGRGYGRNEFENQGGASGQDHIGAGRNGEGNQKVHQNGDRRAPRQPRQA